MAPPNTHHRGGGRATLTVLSYVDGDVGKSSTPSPTGGGGGRRGGREGGLAPIQRCPLQTLLSKTTQPPPYSPRPPAQQGGVAPWS